MYNLVSVMQDLSGFMSITEHSRGISPEISVELVHRIYDSKILVIIGQSCKIFLCIEELI